MCGLGPHTWVGKHLNARGLVPEILRFDCIRDGKGQVGADIMAYMVIHMCMATHRMYMLPIAALAFMLPYYGPEALAVPTTCAALTFIMF